MRAYDPVSGRDVFAPHIRCELPDVIEQVGRDEGVAGRNQKLDRNGRCATRG